MSLITIRAFKIGDQQYRHAMTRRLAELSAEKTTVPAGTAKVTPQ